MIEAMKMGYFETNCFLFACDETRKGVVIDPGVNAPEIKEWIEEKGLDLEYILLTHGHLDHISAVDQLRQMFPNAKVGIHTEDADMMGNTHLNLSVMFGVIVEINPPDFLLEDGQVLTVGKEEIKVLHTPGHTRGSVCFLTSEALFSGDTLFAGAIGRADFPGGSEETLLKSIKEKLLVLPPDTLVLSGHTGETTIGQEKDNPFFQ